MKKQQDLEELTLDEILKKEDLEMEEILSIPNIHEKIRKRLPDFIEYCIKNQEFTRKLINLGLKCPMHESKNEPMKARAFVAADILTTENDSIADLFIRSSLIEEIYSSDDESQIYEEIITDELSTTVTTVIANRKSSTNSLQSNRYKYLLQLLDYFKAQSPEENCLNYISKTLNLLVARRSTELFRFYKNYPEYFQRLTYFCTFPSISQHLAKLITFEEDAHTLKPFKQALIQKILLKLHSEIGKKSSEQILDFIEDIFQCNRNADTGESQRAEILQLSDIFVSEKEIRYFIETIIQNLNPNESQLYQSYFTIVNCLAYLNMAIKRANFDEEINDYNKDTKDPTLKYQFSKLYEAFFLLILCSDKIDKFNHFTRQEIVFLKLRYFELLLNLVKHSKIKEYYETYAKNIRTNCLIKLTKLFFHQDTNGILKNNFISLIDKLLTFENQIKIQNTQFQRIEMSSVIDAPTDLRLSTLIGQIEEKRNKTQNKKEGIPYLIKSYLLFKNYNNQFPKEQPKREKQYIQLQSTTNKKLNNILNHYDEELASQSKSKNVEEFNFISSFNYSEENNERKNSIEKEDSENQQFIEFFSDMLKDKPQELNSRREKQIALNLDLMKKKIDYRKIKSKASMNKQKSQLQEQIHESEVKNEQITAQFNHQDSKNQQFMLFVSNMLNHQSSELDNSRKEKPQIALNIGLMDQIIKRKKLKSKASINKEKSQFQEKLHEPEVKNEQSSVQINHFHPNNQIHKEVVREAEKCEELAQQSEPAQLRQPTQLSQLAQLNEPAQSKQLSQPVMSQKEQAFFVKHLMIY